MMQSSKVGAFDVQTIQAMAKAFGCSSAQVEQALATQNPAQTLADLVETKKPGALCIPQAPCVEPCRPRDTKLPKPHGHACMGRFQAPAAPAGRDPLVIKLEHIKPGAELFMIRRRADEAFDFDEAIKLPADTEKFVDAAGNYNIVFDDAWCLDHGIAPGHVLEIRQRMPDGSRASDGLVIPINAQGMPCTTARVGQRGTAQQIILPPGDRIGNLQVLPLFIHEPDTNPPSVDPCRMSHSLEKNKLVVSGAAEPFSKILVENFSTGARSDVVDVGPTGRFKASVAADKNQGFLVHVLDHGGTFDANLRPNRPSHERILAGVTGMCESLVLVENPRLGASGPTEIRLSRSSVSGDKLIFERGVTPGSMVTVRNESGEPVRDYRTISSARGSFILPADLHEDDIIQLTVANPFRTASDATTTIRAKVVAGKKGCELSLMEDYADAAFVKGLPRGPIAESSTVDDVASALPKAEPLPFSIGQIQGGEMSLSVQLSSPSSASKDGRVQAQSSIEFDRETRTIKMTVGMTRHGGYEKRDAPTTATTAARILPEHNQGAYHQNFPHTVTGAWKLEIVNTQGQLLATGELEATRKSRTHVSSSYDGRGGILPVSSIPRGTVSTTQHTMFEVKSYAPCS